MVQATPAAPEGLVFRLSVLALSSRFDGPQRRPRRIRSEQMLSVLALSSRFDGPTASADGQTPPNGFQYSLCRVVLMVLRGGFLRLCFLRLSVLALSSRFDGPRYSDGIRMLWWWLSVLALSSRFDGPQHDFHLGQRLIHFQYSLCRVVLMVRKNSRFFSSPSSAFSTRSVESF